MPRNSTAFTIDAGSWHHATRRAEPLGARGVSYQFGSRSEGTGSPWNRGAGSVQLRAELWLQATSITSILTLVRGYSFSNTRIPKACALITTTCTSNKRSAAIPVPSENLIRWICSRKENWLMIERDRCHDQSDAEWLACQITEAFPWDTVPGILIRDNDGAYGEAFTRRLRAMGIRDRPIAPRSPWQNGYVERSIGSIRRECLDHVIIWGEAHLRHVHKAYTAYYNATRTYLEIDKDAPNRRPIERRGVIVANAVLGGLHHRYARI